MVRITKIMQPKHAESLSPWIRDFRDKACCLPLFELAPFLSTFPTRWPFPRGDLYHWISLLNRFDHILEQFCKAYKLDEGPQLVEFSTLLLEADHVKSNNQSSQITDDQIIECILNFSRVLLQNCGNRSIYSSSAYLHSLLNTTSLSLLEHTLLLGSELAQRYQAAMKRLSMSTRHTNSPLLLSHYNIPLEKVIQLALPFSRIVCSSTEGAHLNCSTSGMKGKEKATQNPSTPLSKGASTTIFANDLVSMIKGGNGIRSNPKSTHHTPENIPSFNVEKSWHEWGDVKIIYYPKSNTEVDGTGGIPSSTPTAVLPTNSTPVRRNSNLGPRGQRTSKNNLETSPASVSSPINNLPSDDSTRSSFKTIEISSSRLLSTDIHTLLRENISGLPLELQHKLLTKLRIARALTSSLETRRQIIAIRLLAITNLAYIYTECPFQELVMKQDKEEPRRLQLIYQLAELVHPTADGDVAIPRSLQALAFATLDALQRHQNKISDVCAALNTNVNHGVLLYVIRKAVAEMENDDSGHQITIDDEWRDSLFSLISSISMTARTAVDLVTAGLIQILVEILNQRSKIAERYYPMVLTFLDTIMYSARDAFQTFVDAEGLQAISNLIVYQVKTSAQIVSLGKGTPTELRSSIVDYEIPFFQQQTIKWLFKFIHHLMSAAGGFGGNFDRLLRNLIDSSQLLASLRQIISNANCYGSIVWTNAVSILNDFINNEPTSFAVIAEAGLSRSLLEAVTNRVITIPDEMKPEETQTETAGSNFEASSSSSYPEASHNKENSQAENSSPAILDAPRKGALAKGILPTSETINILPQSFGAICLNTAGMKMFQASKALESFFEIFESPEHVKCMDAHKDLPVTLGSSFDELARHHPSLKTSIITAILKMVRRVDHLCSSEAKNNLLGARLWSSTTEKITTTIHDTLQPLPNSPKKPNQPHTGTDIEMCDADAGLNSTNLANPANPDGSATNMTPYICATFNFLYSILGNNSIRAEFCSLGGIESVLSLSQSPSLEYDFWDSTYNLPVRQVMAMLAESKPHLTLPSLIKRAISSANDLQDFANFSEPSSFFGPFVNPQCLASAGPDLLSNGTRFAKALVSVHSLICTIPTCLQSSPYNHRTSSTIFNQINVADYCIQLVHVLGPLLGSSIREVVKLRKLVPDHWKDATGNDDSLNSIFSNCPITGTRASQIGDSFEVLPIMASSSNIVDSSLSVIGSLASQEAMSTTTSKKNLESPHFKNYITLRFLLKKLPRIISPFFQTLGKILLTKRNLDSFQKQYHFAIADALAVTLLKQLAIEDKSNTADTYTYWLGLIAVLHELLIETARQGDRPIQAITLVVHAFKSRGGFERLNQMIGIFTNEICHHKSQTSSQDASLRLELATSGTLSLLSLYSYLASGKNFIETPQTTALMTRPERDRRGQDFFSPIQFLIEIRLMILPTVRQLWSSDFIEKCTSPISETLVNLIRIIITGDAEISSISRPEKPTTLLKTTHKTFKINQDSLTTLLDQGYSASLGTEALYRCNNNVNFALEYCRDLRDEEDLKRRNPIPEKDIDTPVEVQSQSRPSATDSNSASIPIIDHPMGQDATPLVMDTFNDIEAPLPNDELANFDQLLTSLVPVMEQGIQTTSGPSSTMPQAPAKESPKDGKAAIDELNEERALISENLIDKCLDAINAHGDVTYEVADLIMTVVNKSSDPPTQRKAIGETLVVALMSFVGEDDLARSGKKIAAYAHLLALLLQDKHFYSATSGDLKQNLDSLLHFVKLSPKHVPEDPSPWIAHILLILEMLLSEDAKPQKVKWTPPINENSVIEAPEIETPELIVPLQIRSKLLDVILEILPRIGKDEPLALSILRVLVAITRSREMAQTMGKKKNIQRLFVMAKQLAGACSARIHSPLMLILRHIVEDNETVKQIMKTEIKASLESTRQPRNFDEKAYLRVLAHSALRNPELFVQVTSETVKFNRCPYSSDSPSRHHGLMLKEHVTDAPQIPPIDTVLPTVQATEDLSIQDCKPFKEIAENEAQENSKLYHEQKLPVVENSDGVIHFLLCELMNYRDVDEKDHSTLSLSVPEKKSTATNPDVLISGASIPPPPPSRDAKAPKLSSKWDFKAEEHPIYIYRCFILQCLTELLSSYNRTKIEFINFKRSSQPHAITASKPRSSVVNYLLYDLIPIGTLEHAESTYLRKKVVTSSWADSVITALLCKTNEQPIDKSRDPYESEVESDLLFVRRFVLENILRAYKDASLSTEGLDSKYSRMLSLAELMTHIMQGKENIGISDPAIAGTSQKQLRRIMFEKGYISALTSSIADIDLNFPGAKRAVKYILRPLKTLTSTAISLSDLSLITAIPGQGDEDEIESAKSLSGQEDEREETPDLFRNSTLGMFEHGTEDSESQSADDEDEDMEGAYDEYVEGMDYDDGEMEENDEDDISDEEDIEGIGSIEGLSGDHQVEVEVIMDDHDDDHDLSPDNEDDPGSDDNEDDDHRVEIMEELEDMQQLDDDDDLAGEWESEGQDDDDDDDGDGDEYEGSYEDQEEGPGSIDLGAMSHLVRALGNDQAALEMLGRMAEGDENEDDHVIGEYGEEDEEDDDENAGDEEDDVYDSHYPIVPGTNVTFGWPRQFDTVVPARHRPRGGISPLPNIASGLRDPYAVPNVTFRSHRPGIPVLSRSTDDGMNPLLQRNRPNGRASSNLPPALSTWIPSLRQPPPAELLDIGFATHGNNVGDGSVATQFIEDVIRTLPIPGQLARNGQALQFHITRSSGVRHIPPELEAFLGGRQTRFEERRGPFEPASATNFTPQSTTTRWSEESKILFGSTWVDKASDLAGTLLSLLVPPAIEADKAQKAAILERALKEQQDAERKAEEERLAEEAKAAEERLANEKKEEEELENTHRASDERNEAGAVLTAGTGTEVENENERDAPESMEGVETELSGSNGPNTTSSTEARPRVTTVIRGTNFDITDLGIDADFLAELPEEIREEVIMSAVAERRILAAATGIQPSEIDQEFLNALPDDIRDEIIQQERRDRRRREREERSRQTPAANGGASVGEMDAATILATLEPTFRNQVLMEQDDATLALLPPEIADQARAAMRDLPGNVRIPNPVVLRHATGGFQSHSIEFRDPHPQRSTRRPIVQILDKSGVATLLRLMFIFQHGSLHDTLNAVLHNVSMNRLNRQEVLSTILHILQDGSIDMVAIERSFAQLSLRAKQPKDSQLKTPQPLKRTIANVGSLTQTNFEASPLMVVSQCLTTLVYLNDVNQHISAFFIMENDSIGGIKRSLSRKGKGKENKASKYAINTLLGLLDRDLVMESSSVMESLSTLLNMITLPLQNLQRKQKDVNEVPIEIPMEVVPSVSGTAGSAASPETLSTNNEQPLDPSAEIINLESVTQIENNTSQAPVTTALECDSAIPIEELESKEESSKYPERKQRPITPPYIPDSNLKLVINIFVARECSSKTFRETLSTIKNLSAIPDAKTVFGRELISKAQSLGEIILVDLEELLPQIQRANTGTEIQGVALAKFSPGGSDQNKLLRVLTALDHLFDPKREKRYKPGETQPETESSQLIVKKGLLFCLYENSTFGRMWQMLSACLNAIRQREHMLNVATILLPLIEALMVVCKNTTKDSPCPISSQGKEVSLTSTPDSRMESLFYTFTEEHRKILNDLVRHTPKLMSGTFSLLVKNPKVLEFDNKRNYFNRSIHAKAPNGRETYPTLQLSVRRDLVFHDSFKSLYFQSGDQMKYGKLSIRFHGEEGIDAGGVTREWFQVLSRQMFDPGYALFIPVSSDRTTFHPNQLSSVNEEHLMFFKFIGRIIGKALYEGRVLDCHFSRAVYKRILGKAVSVKDMESLDPDYYKSLVWMLENDITDIITETFSVDSDKFGVNETIDFIPNGRNINVTEENKHEYVRLMVEWRLTGSVKEQLDEFLKGFHDIIPANLVSIFNEQELELLISGLPEIDVEDWKGNTEYHNYLTSSAQIQWFWRAVRSFDKEERAKLLQFVTGTSKVPLNGFKELEGMNGFSRFNIHRDYGDKARLPSSHTCFNQLDIPEYESYEVLRQQLLTAITAGSDYFGFA